MSTIHKIYLLVFILSFSLNSGFMTAQETKKPNIVLFLVDDMGWQDTSVPFWDLKTPLNMLYHTPNMERLASQGMKFTQAYAAPICSPTRVSLMTGMNTARHRVTNWTLEKNASNDAKDDTLQFPLWNVNGLSPVANIERTVHATALPQILKNNGYFTIHAGKAHFGAISTPGENPENIGFDINIAGHASGAPESYLGTENFGNNKSAIWGVPGLEKYHGKDIFLTEALTLEALNSVDHAVAEKTPFFLYMSHYAVHFPFYGDDRFLAKYLEAGMNEIEAKYASMIEGMDKSLGDIMDYLEENNLTENTIILFMSDNGGLSAHARGGAPNIHNKPLASGKGSFYEGGIREPMIVKWPGVTPAASATDEMLIIEDFFPTILELAEIKDYKTVQVVDGKSFTGILQNPHSQTEASKRPLFWHFPNKWGASGPGIAPGSSVRLGDWKLIYYHKTQDFELFNIKEDIGEQNDLSMSYPEKVKEMAKILANHLRETEAQMPTYKKTGEKVPYPDEV